MNRTHILNELNISNVNEEVNLYGWVKNHRNFGEIIFIDLGDSYGITQVVVENNNLELNEMAQKLRSEFCINVSGVVRERSDKNPNLQTGEIEVVATKLSIINESKVLPINLNDEEESLEDTRFKYRYLDLRRHSIQNNLKVRHQVTRIIRNFLDENNFIEIETPILTKSTPEGARDYLVPSRVNKHQFYALPQSPQIYKNMLMNSTIDKYYQFSKSFRDEDLRSDRQPEFTQIDMEMAFMSEQQIRDLVEEMLKDVMKNLKNIEYKDKFDVLTYDRAMNDYGIDKPDTRFEMKLIDLTKIFVNSEFNIFKNAEFVKALNVKDGASNYSRKDLLKLEELAKQHGAKGMPWLKYNDNEFSGTIVKVLTEEELQQIKEFMNVENGDLLIFASDIFKTVCDVLGNLRNIIAKNMNLYEKDSYKFLWVTDWPLFEFDEEDNRYYAMHHPFTMPKDHKFSDDLENQKAIAYDIVLNGYELGGGSIRINKPELQLEMFKKLGFTDQEVEDEFGFLLEAYSYGAPYHGGLAIGFDRLMMILTNNDAIKEVIAFPKNNKAVEVMLKSPGEVKTSQLDELHIKLIDEEK